MAIELPNEIAQLLQFIGIPWINVNEDSVRQFAAHMRKFASDASNTHQNAEATLKSLGEGYQGEAYEAMVRMWGSKSVHIHEMAEACGVLASALDVGAGVIEAQKLYCIGELGVMAAEFVADQAAAVATLGIAEAALPVIEETTAKVMQFAAQQVEQEITGNVLNAALQPLMDKLANMMTGFLFDAGGGGGGAGSGFEVDHEHLAAKAQEMQGHADTAHGHAVELMSNLSTLDFGS